MLFRTGYILLFVLMLASVSPRDMQAQEITYQVDTARSILAYTGHHPAHSWTGTSHQVVGTLSLDVNTPAWSQITVRVPVQSFDSRNSVRDGRMLRLVHSSSYPEVTFRSAVIHVDAWTQTTHGYEGKWRMRGPLTFHGQTHAVEIPTTIRIKGRELVANCAFSVSLKRFQVARPKLLFVPIKEHIDLFGTIRGVAASLSSGK